MANLTDAKARNMKHGDGILPHGGITGLSLHPSLTKGQGKWVMRYVSPVSKKRRNAGLGSYPEVGIADAVDVVTHLLPQQPGKAVRVKHQPAMPWADIPSYVAAHLSGKNPFDVSRSMLEFLILTACRSGEARMMTWTEVCFEKAIWTIPAERMKAKQIHRVPLTQRVIEILGQQQGLHPILVFPSPRDQVPLTDMALTSLLRRTNAHSDVEGRTATAHGFRSSFRDWCSEHGYARDLAERALAHTVQNKVEAAYHRTDLLEKRRPMMEAWEQHVLSKTTQR